MDNYISVIITIYKRKEFYKEAIESALNQTLDHSHYEVIVVHHIDIETIYNNVKYIKCNDISIGAQLALGIKNAKGDIISFLDDDDIFMPNKLKYVYDTFKDKNLVYLHNDYKSNDASFRNKNPDFNMSCISIRKEVINENLDKIYLLPDTLMYLSAIDSGKKLLISNEKLTLYRVQGSNISITKQKNERINLFLLYSSQYESFLNMFSSKKSHRLIKVRITNFNIYLYLNGVPRDNIFPFLYLFSSYLSPSIRIKNVFAYLLYKTGIFRRLIIKMVNAS